MDNSTALEEAGLLAPEQQRKSPHKSRCIMATLILALLWSIWFTGYIFAWFFVKPVEDWKSISDYSQEPRTAPIALHWIGGIVVILTGPFQLMQSVRTKWPRFHRWTGRIYLSLGCLPASIAGLVYIVLNGTVGGLVMDIAFLIYGAVFFISGLMTYIRVRQRKIQVHRAWAIRTFNIGMGSPLYRLLTSPFVFAGIAGYNIADWEITSVWLNVAAYLMFVPGMIVVEIYLYKKFSRMSGKSYLDSF
jgi:hypothetical protein